MSWPRKLWEGQMESLRKLHNWDQRLSSWQIGRQYYNYFSSELFLFFHLPFIFLPCKRQPYGISVMFMSLLVLAGVCVHIRESQYSSENPIKGDMYWFAALFKAFWDISTDISFSVRANGKKQTNLLLTSFLSFFPLFYLFSSFSVTLHQSLFDTLLAISSPSHRCAIARCNIFLKKNVLLSVRFSLHHKCLNW